MFCLHRVETTHEIYTKLKTKSCHSMLFSDNGKYISCILPNAAFMSIQICSYCRLDLWFMWCSKVAYGEVENAHCLESVLQGSATQRDRKTSKLYLGFSSAGYGSSINHSLLSMHGRIDCLSSESQDIKRIKPYLSHSCFPVGICKCSGFLACYWKCFSLSVLTLLLPSRVGV